MLLVNLLCVQGQAYLSLLLLQIDLRINYYHKDGT